MKHHTRTLLIAMTVLVVAGCKEGKELNAWVEATEKFKVKAQDATAVMPYRAEQQEAFKAYFSQVTEMANRLKDDSAFSDKFSKLASTSDLSMVCGKVFLPKTEWSVIVERCTRNGFFLCAEEVKSYGDVVTVIRSYLSTEMKQRFDGTPTCAAAINSSLYLR
jgi:hypothetical protein